MTHTLELYFSNVCVQDCPGCGMGLSRAKSSIVPKDQDSILQDQQSVLALMGAVRTRFSDTKFDAMINSPSTALGEDFPFNDQVFHGIAGLHLSFDKDTLPVRNLPTVERALKGISPSHITLGGNCGTYDAETLAKTARDYISILINTIDDHPEVERIGFIHSANEMSEIWEPSVTASKLNDLGIDREIEGYHFIPGTSVKNTTIHRMRLNFHEAGFSAAGVYQDIRGRKLTIERDFRFVHLVYGFGKVPQSSEGISSDSANISITPRLVIPAHSSLSMGQHKKTHSQSLDILERLPAEASFPDFVRALL